MRSIRIVSLKNQTVIAEKCFEAVRFLDRLRGLIARPALAADQAMWFPRCSSIHTFWMSFAIDVIFLRPSHGRPGVWEVTSIRSDVRPWRPMVSDRKASAVLEMSAGVARQRGLSPGDEVECIV